MSSKTKGCVKCNNHPCKCGWEYRNGIREVRLELAANILGIDSYLIEKTVGHLIPNDHPMKENS